MLDSPPWVWRAWVRWKQRPELAQRRELGLAQGRGAEAPWARRPAAPLVGRLRERVQALRELVSESMAFEKPLESAAAREGLAEWVRPPAWRRPWAEVLRAPARLLQARVPHAGMRGSER
jgi:hypothetical protein